MKVSTKNVFVTIFIFLVAILINGKSYASEITTNYYGMDLEENIICEIEPETTVDEFKSKIDIQSANIAYEDYDEIYANMKVFREKDCITEVTEGNVGTGMYLNYEDELYQLSVVGDFDGDGKATQVELTNIIRYIVGLQGAELEGVKYRSADLTLDEIVDQRDITKYIRYIVFGELDLGKVDKTPPTVILDAIKQTTNELVIGAKAIDRESGMGENPIFTFYVKKSNEPESSYKEVQKEAKSTVDLEGLEQDTWYDIKVVVQDKAGNEGSDSGSAITGKIPDGTEEGAIIFGDINWENGMASITISTEKEREILVDDTIETDGKFPIEYQVNGTNGVWKKGEYVTGLKHGDILYARLTDGTNSGTFIFKTIEDDEEPEIAMNIVTNETELSATATVVDAKDNESGIESNPDYTFYIKEESEPDANYKQIQKGKNKTCDIKSLEANKTYIVKVEVQDKAGNIGKAEEKIRIDQKEEEIPDATEAGAIIFGAPTWSSGQAEVTISTTTKYQIEYQVNGTSGTWTKGTTVSGLNHNDIIYARLTDGTKSGSYTTLTIIDAIAPQLNITTTGDTSKITATATAQDKETGIDGSSNYVFYVRKSSEPASSYVEVQRSTSTTCDITGLQANETYIIKVEIEDKAGNKATKETSATTSQIPAGTQAGSIIFSSIVWNMGQAEVTITTSTKYQIEYQVNGTSGTWTKGTTVTGLNHNDIIYARLTDGTNAGNYTTLTVVDAVKPNIELDLQARNQEITATASVTDDESGIDTNVNYIFYIKETGEPETSYIQKQSSTSAICNIPSLIVGKNYTIKVEAEDKAGNKGMIEKSILIPDDIAPVVSLSVTGKTSNTATVQASATDVGGLPTPTIYVFYIKETGADDSTYVEIQNSDNSQCTFTGLEQNKDYTVKVTVADEAGNIGIKETSILTDKIPDATTAGAITFNSIVWNSGTATVTIGTNTSYQIEYQVNGTTGTWTKGTTVTGLNHNDVIYARLTDGKNVSGHATVTVVDSVKPQVALSLTSDTSKVTAIANAVDNETGLGTNPIYTFYIKETTQPDSSYIEKQKTTSNTCDITGLEQSKNYTIKVEVADLAGNIGSKQETISTKTIPDATTAGAIKFGAIIWNSGKAEVAISTSTTLQIEYQVNGTTGTWIKGTTVTGLNHNDVIYARLTDGTNAGKYATLTIADTTPPEAFTISVTDIKPTGFKVSGNTLDNQTGIASYTYVVEKGGIKTSASTKAESYNINRIGYYDNNTANTSRSNNRNIKRRKRIDIKSKTSKSRANESRSKRKYRACNNGNTNK